MKDIKKKIKKNAELIKKESSDSEKKQQSEKKNIDSGNKEASQNSREHMAPPQVLFPENISSRYGITAGIHDQNIYHPFMQVPVRDPRNHGHPSAPPLIFYPPLY